MIKYYNQVERVAKWLLVLSLAVMALINIMNVISRYFLSASLAYTEELVTNLFVYNTYIGASIAARKGAHLGLPIIYERLSETNQKRLMFGVAVVSAAMFFLLVRYGVVMVADQIKFGQRTPALGLPQWIFGAAIPIGGFFIAIAFLVGGYETLKGKR